MAVENQPVVGGTAMVSGAHLATTLGLPAADSASLRHPRVLEVVLRRTATQATSFPRHAVPRVVVLSAEPCTKDAMLKPTPRLRRPNLMVRLEVELRAGDVRTALRPWPGELPSR